MCVKGTYEGSYGLLPVEDSCTPAFDVDMLEAVPLAVWIWFCDARSSNGGEWMWWWSDAVYWEDKLRDGADDEEQESNSCCESQETTFSTL